MKYLIVLIVAVGLVGYFQSSKPLYGYWDSTLEAHNNLTVDVVATCHYSDGSIQVQRTLGFDDKTTVFPSCTN